MADTQRFLNAYNIVLDEKGNFKTCGREACMNLISVANELEPEISHGNIANGMVNSTLVTRLRDKIIKSN